MHWYRQEGLGMERECLSLLGPVVLLLAVAVRTTTCQDTGKRRCGLFSIWERHAGGKTKKRKKEEEIEKGANPKSFFFWDFVGQAWTKRYRITRKQESNALAGYTTGPSSESEVGPVVHPANAFDSRQRGDSVPLGSSPTKSQKKSGLWLSGDQEWEVILWLSCRLNWHARTYWSDSKSWTALGIPFLDYSAASNVALVAAFRQDVFDV